MALPVAGCDLREGAQERPGGQCGGNNRLRSQLGRTLGNHRDGYRRVRSESVLAGLPAQPERALRSSVTTDRCSTTCFVVPPVPCSGTRASWALRSASSAPCTPTEASSISIRTSTSQLPAAASMSNTALGAFCSSKKNSRLKPSGAMPLSVCCVPAKIESIPASCPTSVISAMRSSGNATCRRNISATGRSTSPKDPPGLAQQYLGRYLKRPPVAASQLRHYRGGSVVHSTTTTIRRSINGRN